MTKIILIDHEPWTRQRKLMMYDLFALAGIRITVWDLSQWLYEGYSNPDELTDEDYLTKIYSREEFKALLACENPKNTIIVNEVYRVWKNRHVFHDISERHFKTIFIDFYANSRLKVWRKTKNTSIIDNIRQFYLNLFSTKHPTPLERIGLKCYFHICKVRPYDFAFSSKADMNDAKGFNHPDYESFKFRNKTRIEDGKYIVFCDTYFPLHSDLRFLLEEKNIPDAKEYQNGMTLLFDAIEEKYGMPIVIAAHPKSDYSGNEFGNRKIIKYNTDNLVYYAEKVVLHVCNSISYSILGDKPIAFVTTDAYLRKTSRANLVKQWEQGLGIKSQNINRIKLKDVTFTKIEPHLRNHYIYSYLTSKETENTPNAATLRKFIEGL